MIALLRKVDERKESVPQFLPQNKDIPEDKLTDIKEDIFDIKSMLMQKGNFGRAVYSYDTPGCNQDKATLR